jgi:hypothetical protein
MILRQQVEFRAREIYRHSSLSHSRIRFEDLPAGYRRTFEAAARTQLDTEHATRRCAS